MLSIETTQSKAGNGGVGVTQEDLIAMIKYGLGTPPPLSGTSRRPTPALLSHGMLMTPGRAALLMSSSGT